VTRRFFDQVDDELRGLLGPALRDFESVRSGSLIKLWYTDPGAHFEAQVVSARWGPEGRPVVEVGLHLESSSPKRNDAVLQALERERTTWSKKLPEAEAGKAIGPRSATWRRLSEVIEAPDLDDPELASEVAERLSFYVKALEPLLRD